MNSNRLRPRSISWIGREFADKRILDLGVGAGRTTPYLLEISKNYIGIDFSPAMIAACQARYPTVEFAVGDARDLSRFRGRLVRFRPVQS